MTTSTTLSTNESDQTQAGSLTLSENYHKDLMRFTHQNQTVGKLNVVDGKLVFTGDADQSARQFFDLVCKLFNSK